MVGVRTRMRGAVSDAAGNALRRARQTVEAVLPHSDAPHEAFSMMKPCKAQPCPSMAQFPSDYCAYHRKKRRLEKEQREVMDYVARKYMGASAAIHQKADEQTQPVEGEET